MGRPKNEQPTVIIAFRVPADVETALRQLAERVSKAAAGVSVSSAEMARTAFMRGMREIEAEMADSKRRR